MTDLVPDESKHSQRFSLQETGDIKKSGSWVVGHLTTPFTAGLLPLLHVELRMGHAAGDQACRESFTDKTENTRSFFARPSVYHFTRTGHAHALYGISFSSIT